MASDSTKVEVEASVLWFKRCIPMYHASHSVLHIAWICLRCNQQIFNRPSEVSFADGIDDRVTYRTERKDTISEKYFLRRNISTFDEPETNVHDPGREKAQHKRGDDNADIQSCSLSVSLRLELPC